MSEVVEVKKASVLDELKALLTDHHQRLSDHLGKQLDDATALHLGVLNEKGAANKFKDDRKFQKPSG
jgi:hypothetical protein